MRFVNKNFFVKALYNTAVPYPVSSNLNYFWSFGIFLLLCLVVQIITGIFLAMHYVPHVDYAFISVEHIMRDVNYGWVLRYVHANGASMFFIAAYMHIFRGLYYGSYVYPRHLLWVIGVVIFLLMILTAFLGYVLPWGQMSFWAATVITNLASAVPYVGEDIVQWLWGGFSVDNATLNRFFSLHYLLPFVIAALSIVHVIFLHEYKSNNPLGIKPVYDVVPFTPYYTVKDIFAVVAFFIFFLSFVYFSPNYLGHTDNYIPANPMVTPTHIVPEWYFLPFYAILRSVPDKLGGVILMVSAILVLAVLPFMHMPGVIRSNKFRPLKRVFYWFFIVDWFILGWIGGCPIEDPYFIIGQVSSFMYFLYFFYLIFAVESVEKMFRHNQVWRNNWRLLPWVWSRVEAGIRFDDRNKRRAGFILKNYWNYRRLVK